jgi:ATP-dependent exoDNAse (exonuclease V) alpha subunit
MLNPCQTQALTLLEGAGNVFLTGGAGSGKSYLVREFLRGRSYPVLASTGAAAILVGGRTFHSFFGLGIMEGGVERTVEKALSNKRLVKRLKDCAGVVIDEISMIPGAALLAAETISRKAREADEPWGGLRVIAVGDFSQLPPVTRDAQVRDWAFASETWRNTEFAPAILREIVRSQDTDFLEVLNLVRHGIADRRVQDFLRSREKVDQPDLEGTRLFPHRGTTEDYNLAQLEKIPGPILTLETEYSGKKEAIENLKKNAPVPELLRIKEGALVMLRQNDPEGRWVNGSVGSLLSIDGETVSVRLQSSGERVYVPRTTFDLLDADGHKVASATNFPLMLAYATTIHKAQGSTLDRMWVNLRNLWEPGHAYVAMSRVRGADSLHVTGWDARSIKVDPRVVAFHQAIGAT